MMVDFLEKLNPANVHDDALQKLSHEEFQKLLCSWYENSGVVSETRSYLRMQLIRMLNTTKLGMQTKKGTHPLPPKVQMINVLVAEHLLRYKYLYTLSMLSNELSVLNIPPEFNFIFVTSNEDTNDQFKRNQILKIVHFLEITLEEDDIEQLFLNYYKNGHNSLLACMLNYMASKEKIPVVEDVSVTSLIKHLKEVLADTNIQLSTIRNIEKCVRQHFTVLQQKMYLELQKEPIYSQLDLANNKKTYVANLNPGQQVSPQLKLVSLHNEKSKMIKKVYKYRLSQMDRMQKQLEEKLKMTDLLREKSQASIEKCTLKHCDTSCQKSLAFFNRLKAENQKLNKLVKARNNDVKKLTLKLAKTLTNLETVQSKILINNNHEWRSEEECSPCKDEQDMSIAHRKAQKESLDDMFADVNKKLEDLESENDMINSEYNLFKKTSLSTFIM